MSDRDKFRVWCENKNEYETHEVVADQDGRLYHHARMSQTLRKDTHIREQCTGLKDKNGTLIFEGDIVKATDQPYCFVKQIHWNGRWYQLGNSDIVLCNMEVDSYGLKIIGKVHLNPELLEA